MTPPKSRRAASSAVLQRTLERYPWARLSDDKGDQLGLELMLDEAGEEGRAWIVTAKSGARMPGPFDADLWVAIGELYNAQIPRAERAERRTIQTTFRELAGVMRRELGGTTYAAIRGALDRLSDAKILAVQTWREGDTVAEIKTFHPLESVAYRLRRGGDESGVAIVIRLAEEIAQSITEKNFRLLDTSHYFSLPSPTSKRLYRYLDLRRWRGNEERDELRLSLRELARELPIDREAPSHIRRTLDPAHEALIQSGYLTGTTYENVEVPGKKRPVTYVVYRFAAPERTLVPIAIASQPIVEPLGWSPRNDPDYLRDMVAEIIGTLRDHHSAGFYTKVVKVFDREPLLNILGGVRQMIREGVSLEVARKTFTATARTRAKAMGISL